MKMKKTALAVSVAGALGLSAPAAFAQVDLETASTAVVFAAEHPDEGIDYYDVGGRLNIEIPMLTSYPVDSGTSPLFVKVGLRDSVEFGATPTLVCQSATDNSYTAIIAVVNNSTNSRATFGFDDGSTMGSACRLLITAGAATVTGSGGFYSVPGGSDFGTVVMSAVYEYQAGLSTASSALIGNIITFDTAAVAALSLDNGNTAANAIINVQDASQSFTVSSSPDQFQAYLGTFSCDVQNPGGNSATVFPESATVGGNTTVTAGDIFNTFSITVNGDPVAGASEITVNPRPLAATEVCAGSPISQSPSGATTVTFTGVLATAVQAGIDICMKVDGATAIEEGQITLDVVPTPNTDWTDKGCALTQGNLFNLEKNGATVKVLNITKSDAQDKTFIRLYNAGTIAGDIIGTLYSQDGSQIGSATVIASLQPKQVDVLTSAEIEQLFGTWTTGRAYMLIDASLADLRVLATLRARSGVLVNMSGEAQ